MILNYLHRVWTTHLAPGTTDRGVSIPLEYAMGFMVLILVSGVFTFGMTELKEQQAEMAIQQELERINYEVSHAIDQTDGLAGQAYEQSGENKTISVYVQLPEHVAGESYSITTNSSDYVIVQSNERDISVATQVDIDHATGITVQSISDGDIIVRYNTTTEQIHVDKP